MAAKKPAPKAAPAKNTSPKAAESKTAPKAATASKTVATKSTPKPSTANGAGKTASAPKAAKKVKSAPAVKKGPIALRTPAKGKPAVPATATSVADTITTPATDLPTTADESGTYYIVVEHDDLRISTAKPKSNGRVETAATFAEAKDKAMDCLIDLIDRFERRLWEVKQSLDHETLVDPD
jgi:hypothetical protein